MRTEITRRPIIPNTDHKGQKGVVQFFNTVLGFGYIAIAPSLKLKIGVEAEHDLYVHRANVLVPFPHNLDPKSRVTFDVHQTLKGPRAVNVEVLR